MAGAKKMTIRSLSEEFEILKKVMLEEVKGLKQTVKDLREEVKELKGNNPEKSTKNTLKCKKCDACFESNKNLKKHINEIHATKIKCVSCEKTFQKNCELEIHIKASHKEIKEYDCDKCDQKFVLKWRLLKHASIHSNNITVKKCHYFNNNKACPYEEVGCMFAHIKADTCKFGKSCSNNLCSYQHSSKEEETVFKCQQCEQVYKSHKDLINHVESIHVEREKIQRDHLFPLKCPNCPKWIYTDDDNESHYDDFEEFGQCETRKRTMLQY